MGNPDEDLVEVYCGNEPAAHIVKGRLESEGIPAVAAPVRDGAVSTFNGFLKLSVLVPRKYALLARKTIGPYNVGKD
ncbi:MAG: DUF2007 domain-containing protein [Chloroflexi bacterium]|nr:DUF2007 domain-containing protein [Chloroflexota bacterium]